MEEVQTAIKEVKLGKSVDPTGLIKEVFIPGGSGLVHSIKGELQRQNKLISSERPFKILQIETKIIKIGQAVLEIFNFKD